MYYGHYEGVLLKTKAEQKALYGCTFAAYKSRISNSVRKLWMISKGRKDALLRSRTHAGTEVRFKYYEHCERCDKAFRLKQKEEVLKKDGTPAKAKRTCLVVHHIDQVPDVFDPKFLVYLFCEQYDNPADGYMVLCHDCHEEVHRELKLNEEVKS